MEDKRSVAFLRLLDIMDTLRAECPWDKKQDIHSLRNLTIEEVYELADSIDKKDWPGIREELGDVLLHIVFYARLGDEEKQFDIEKVINEQCDKLIRRHPHIYGEVKVKDEEEVKRNWEAIKQQEKKEKAQGVLAGVPAGLPAMIKAYRMQDKTRQVGFEWDTIDHVWEKVKEEIGELEEVVSGGGAKQDIEGEFGDVLFSLINYARYLDIDPETALEKVNRKFRSRFEYLESRAPRPLREMSLEEMDVLWDEAKALEKKGK